MPPAFVICAFAQPGAQSLQPAIRCCRLPTSVTDPGAAPAALPNASSVTTAATAAAIIPLALMSPLSFLSPEPHPERHDRAGGRPAVECEHDGSDLHALVLPELRR